MLKVLECSGIMSRMMACLNASRSKVDTTDDLAPLIRTSMLLATQGWRDHADTL